MLASTEISDVWDKMVKPYSPAQPPAEWNFMRSPSQHHVEQKNHAAQTEL